MKSNANRHYESTRHAKFLLASRFPELKKQGSIWSRSYFCATTGSVSSEVIRQYIESQWSKIK